MKFLLHGFIAAVLMSGFVFAQDNLNFTQFDSKQLNKEIENFNNGMQAGLSVLDWTDATCPSIFRISAGIFLGFGSADKNPAIGLKDDIFFPASAGLQLGFGTAGFEAYARLLPKTDAFNYSLKGLGFGIKYEISDLIPAPGMPALALFADYNTLGFALNQSKIATVDNFSGRVQTDISLDYSTINIGTIMSYDFVVLRVYGKLAVEIGSTDMKWNRAVLDNSDNVVADKTSGTFDGTGLRYAVGVVLFGVRAEVGGRGSSMFAGVGYGISI